MLRPDQTWTNVRAIGKTATEARHLVAMDEAEFKTAVEAIEGCGNA